MKKYSTFKGHPDSESLYSDDGVTFTKSDTTCDINIDALDFDLHDGAWKCHIADTDRNQSSSVVIESNWATLHVAQQSSKILRDMLLPIFN